MHVQRKKWVLIKNVAFLKVNFIFRPPPPPTTTTMSHFAIFLKAPPYSYAIQ